MNIFLKILLVAVLLVLAIKFSPVLFFFGLVGLFTAAILGVVGLSLLVALLAVVLAFAIALSPIWIPVLAIIGLISLFKRSGGSSGNGATPPPVAA
ncbi:MAG: hypothetical protein C0502_07815 [Opitutus sp.]|nr:hypothetical protein [Opitutus sp.]